VEAFENADGRVFREHLLEDEEVDFGFCEHAFLTLFDLFGVGSVGGDVMLFDALAEIQEAATEGFKAVKICVGKSAGEQSAEALGGLDEKYAGVRFGGSQCGGNTARGAAIDEDVRGGFCGMNWEAE
jgi:hypothetical protein